MLPESVGQHPIQRINVVQGGAPYNGGFDPSNLTYFYSLASTGLPGFVIGEPFSPAAAFRQPSPLLPPLVPAAGIVCWVFLMLFFLVRFCYCCCKRPCCPYPRKNVSRKKKLGLNVAITVIFLAAIAGAAQVWAGGPMTATQVGNLVNILIGEVNTIINTMQNIVNSVNTVVGLGLPNLSSSNLPTAQLTSALNSVTSVQSTVNNVNSQITNALNQMKTASIAVAAGFAGLLIIFYIILVIWRGACCSFFTSPGWCCRVKNESCCLQAAAGLASPWPSCPGC